MMGMKWFWKLFQDMHERVRAKYWTCFRHLVGNDNEVVGCWLGVGSGYSWKVGPSFWILLCLQSFIRYAAFCTVVAMNHCTSVPALVQRSRPRFQYSYWAERSFIFSMPLPTRQFWLMFNRDFRNCQHLSIICVPRGLVLISFLEAGTLWDFISIYVFWLDPTELCPYFHICFFGGRPGHARLLAPL